MKKVFLAAVTLISVAFVGNANAQNTTAEVNVNIKLYKVQSISVSTPSVDLEYKTEADYRTGVTTAVNDHLVVFSTGGFIVKVKAESDFMKGSSESIAANTVQVIAADGSKKPTGTLNYADNLMLSTTQAPLITSGKGGADLKFKISYKGGFGDDYIVDRFKNGDGNPNIYTAKVTYEIVPN
ncbi:MAG: hypothetical protein KF870_03850 [Leadbetterella sp.]|nr:hypothetical protein [Leadbetterella sp.]